jgi:ATP-dependent helicase/nuclease subunit A
VIRRLPPFSGPRAGPRCRSSPRFLRHLVDYKTNRPPPTDVAAIAPAYLFQLAAYRLALAQIYPGKTVRAAILWTDGARLMPIPDAMLDEYAAKLWTLERVA